MGFFDEYLEQFCGALDDEIAAQKAIGGQKLTLVRGEFLSENAGRYVYNFLCDREPGIHDSTPIELEIQNQRVSGEVVSSESFELWLALDVYIGQKVRQCHLIVKLWYILEKLRDSLRTVDSYRPESNNLFRVLINNLPGRLESRPPHETFITAFRRDVNDYQWKAIEIGWREPISFIWGPPGTGKTRTLGFLSRLLFEEGQSCLILAHSNVAVDQAILALAKLLPKNRQSWLRQVIRYGFHRLPKLKEEFPELLPAELWRRANQHQAQRLDELQAKWRDRKQNRTGQIIFSEAERHELRMLQEEIRRFADELVGRARIVACTFSKLGLSDILQRRSFDSIIIDEASMAYIPAVALASSLSNQRVIIAGDFRQLAPIIQSDSLRVQNWLKRDIFNLCGVVDNVESGRNSPRLAFLKLQYRMHPDICRPVNEFFYRAELEIDERFLDGSFRIAAKAPLPSKALLLVDTSKLATICLKDRPEYGYSRLNLINALIGGLIVEDLQRNDIHSIGLLSPYSSQARLYRLLAQNAEWKTEIVASTIHRFQGGESDVIIFDLTEAPPLPYLSRLLNESNGDDTARLLNVALSRAKGKLIIIGDMKHLRNLARADSIFGQVLRYIVLYGRPLDFSSLTTNNLSKKLIGKTNHSWEEIPEFHDDLRQAKHEIALSIGEPLSTKVKNWLAEADQRSVNIFACGQSAIDLKNSNKFKNLIVWDTGKVLLHAFAIDRQNLWTRPICREDKLSHIWSISGNLTIDFLIGYLDLLPLADRRRPLPGTDDFEKNGPLGRTCSCGGMWLLTNGRYGPYLQCRSCRRPRKLDESAATAYLYTIRARCPNCGAQLRAVTVRPSMRVFVGCPNYRDCGFNGASLENYFG